MIGFDSRHDINATLDHPLVGGALARAGSEPAFELTVPVPALADIAVGYDAIFQFTTPILTEHLGRVVGRTAWTIISYDTSNLSLATRQEILRRLREAIQPAAPSPGSTGGSIIVVGGSSGGITTPTAEPTELPNPMALRITVHSPDVDLALPGSEFDAVVGWVVDIEVGVPEAAPQSGRFPGLTVGTPVDLNLGLGAAGTDVGVSLPGGTVSTGGGASLRFIPLTQGTADTQAHVQSEAVASQYQTWARLDFSGSNISHQASGDVLFDQLLANQVNQQLSNGIDQTLAIVFAHPNLNITPRMALGGVLHPAETLADLQTFRVQHTTGFGNRPKRRVLSLCINVGPAHVVGDLGFVQAFVDDKSFAYYVSEPIVRAALRTRWGRQFFSREFRAYVPLMMELANNPGVVIQGRGHVRFRVLDFTRISFDVTTVDLPDAITLEGLAEITLLEAWDDANSKIQDLGTYAAPELTTFAWRIYPYGGVPPLPTGPAQQFFQSLGTQLLEPIDRPSAEPIRVTNVAGGISAPLQALFARAQLSF